MFSRNILEKKAVYVIILSISCIVKKIDEQYTYTRNLRSLIHTRTYTHTYIYTCTCYIHKKLNS